MFLGTILNSLRYYVQFFSPLLRAWDRSKHTTVILVLLVVSSRLQPPMTMGQSIFHPTPSQQLHTTSVRPGGISTVPLLFLIAYAACPFRALNSAATASTGKLWALPVPLRKPKPMPKSASARLQISSSTLSGAIDQLSNFRRSLWSSHPLTYLDTATLQIAISLLIASAPLRTRYSCTSPSTTATAILGVVHSLYTGISWTPPTTTKLLLCCTRMLLVLKHVQGILSYWVAIATL